MNDLVLQIVTRIDEIMRNERNEPLDVLGSYIVGATLARDDAEQLFRAYSQLEKIGELGADLETLGNSDVAERVFTQIEQELLDFKTNNRQ